MIRHQVFLPCVGFLLLLAPTSTAAVLFSDDFDDLLGATRFSAPFFSAETGSIDGLVDYALDYGTVLSLPPAPHSTGGTTIGLGIQVNNTDQPIDEGEAIGVSPLIAGLSGDYKVRADAYIHYISGGGASEHAVLGVNAEGTAVPFTFVTAGAGQYYHIPHDSGLANTAYADDYYRVADGTITKLYDGDDGTPVPDPSTLGIFPSGSSANVAFDDEGFPGEQWMQLELLKSGSTLSLSINGILVDTYDIGAGATSGDIVLGGADIFNSANSTNWIIFDNVQVIPEPATFVLLALAGLGLAGRATKDK